MVEVGRHINIELLTLSEVSGVSGEEGSFTVALKQHPRYVDVDKCIACGMCAEKCPRKIPNEYNGGLNQRKAIYIPYAQAVPLKYAIDPDQCMYLTKSKCKACQKFCPAHAVNFEDRLTERDIDVGAIVLSAGSRAYDPAAYDVYGFQKSPNIVTSLEFERILSASGPYGGHLVRPMDHQEPKKIAWLQCVGSRDVHQPGRGYCSSVCCTYAVKEAMLAKEHSMGKNLDTAIFYIDIRTFGKNFEQYYTHARDDLGVRFIKSRIPVVEPVNENQMHMIRYVDETGRRKEEEFDIVVLSVGLAVDKSTVELAHRLNVSLDLYGYARTDSFRPVETSQPGIYVCGAFQGPKDIPSSVIDASAAAGAAGSRLNSARWTLTRTREIPEETDIRGMPPNIGVFICSCGTNIAGYVDVPALVEYASGLPGVAYAETNLFSCSQDTQHKMAEIIRERRLNRVVVAACTPKSHESLFQETLINSGLNKYLFEMANIRNQCSWVHKENKEQANEKAKDLVRMAVAKVAMHEPLADPVLSIKEAALVIGGGVSGMMAAKTLSVQKFKTYLIEKSDVLGGNARHLQKTWKNEDIRQYISKLIEDVHSDNNIEVVFNAEINKVEGFVGSFKTTVASGHREQVFEHGVTIIASGAAELKPEGYRYGEDPRVITNMELESRLADESMPNNFEHIVFVQCVGSRIPERPYCSKVCCTQSIKNAVSLKERNDHCEVYILYRDMRPYGLREDLYRSAREKGIHFIRYDFGQPFEIRGNNGHLNVCFSDCVFRRKMEIRANLLVLASAIINDKENPLAQFYKVPVSDSGFFEEAHVKLRPSDFATEGVFVCGLAHSPKPVDESIAQAQAAAARAVTVLSSKNVSVSGMVAYVDERICSACGVCIAVCPYGAPKFHDKTGKSKITDTLCKGCGLCCASCRSGAIFLKGFETAQILNMIESCLEH